MINKLKNDIIMNKTMHDFYNRIESEYEVEKNSLNIFLEFTDSSKISKTDIKYEFISLNNFESNIFNEEINKTKGDIIDYFTHRIQETRNHHLQAKYNHLLLHITHNNNYASKALKYYQEILSYYLSIHNRDFNDLNFLTALNKVTSLSVKYNIYKEDLKRQIDGYLNDSSLSSKAKTLILEMIGKNEQRLFKSDDVLNYPQLCIDLATNEDNVNLKERLLKTAVLLAQKASNKELGKTANEMLGDLEYSHILPLDKNNIAVSHMNENHFNKIINYYRLAGQKEKATKAIKEFEKNKKHHKYIKFQCKTSIENAQQEYEVVNAYLDQLLDSTSKMLILKLCFDNNSLLFPPNKTIKETIKNQTDEFEIHKYFTSKLKDFNNNTTSVSHEKLSEHQFYNILLKSYTLPFIVELLKRSINKNKISYYQIKKTLEQSAFGISFEINRGNSKINYTWFSLINIGIKDFLKQFQKAVNMKQTDWRFTIDFLAPKFEAIFRKIVEYAGGDITRIKENGDSELKPLEDLFASTAIKEIFNEDDIFLFRHTFTKVGCNIRNNVAHGLYKPCDYTLSKAILVFLCILRLNKITVYIENNKKKP